MAKSKKRSPEKNAKKQTPASHLTLMEAAEARLAAETPEATLPKADVEATLAEPAETPKEDLPSKADTETAEMYALIHRLMDDMGASSLSALSDMIDRAEEQKLIKAYGLDAAAARLFLAQQEKVRSLRQAEKQAMREAVYAEMRRDPLYADVDERRAAMEALSLRSGLSPKEAYNALFAEARLRALLAENEKAEARADRKAKTIPALSGGSAPDTHMHTELSESEKWAAKRAGISAEDYARYKYSY